MELKLNNNFSTVSSSSSGSSLFFELKQVLYGGESTREEINNESCFNYLSTKLAISDTILATFVIVSLVAFAMRNHTSSKVPHEQTTTSEQPAMKTLLLTCLCIVLGMEIGFKLASKEAIFFLFFCHLITVIEIYLLAVPPSPKSTAVLRCLIHILHLAFFGIIFMDVKGRQFHGEVALSWIQHLLIYVVVPPYLVYQRGIHVLEPLSDFTWASISAALFLVVCYFIHQPISLVTGVNLNFLLCPLSPFPFEGPYYRLAAIFHQTAFILTLGKLYSVVLHLFLPNNKDMKYTN